MINVKNGYILSVTTNSMNEELQNSINTAPIAQEGYGCRLNADTLAWELYELPTTHTVDEEATIEDYERILSEVGI